MKGIIICNGAIEDYSYYQKYLRDADLILCADGGAAHARKLGVRPDLLLGDFDSIQTADLDYFRELGVQISRFPVEKDMTDTELAVDIAAEKGCRRLVLIGCIGSRMDHSLANVCMLKGMLDRGIEGCLVNEHNEITLIRDRIGLFREEGVKVSLLPLSERVEGVTTRGLYYPLENATLEMGSTWGVSNEFSEAAAEVTVQKGLLLVVKSRD